MRFEETRPPRLFAVGRGGSIRIADCGKVSLAADEQLTFVTPEGRQYDVVAKSWGFYATPSVNGRLRDQGFRTALVRNPLGRHFVMIVDSSRLADFESYLASESMSVAEWLDERA